MADQEFAEPGHSELPSSTRQVQRVEPLPPDYPHLLYPVPCQQCGVAARVGVANSFLTLKHAEHSILVFESGLAFSHTCQTCGITTDATNTIMALVTHEHWEHAPAVGVVASRVEQWYEQGTPATCVYHARLTIRCGLCAWGEMRSIAERATFRYRVRRVDEGREAFSLEQRVRPHPRKLRRRKAPANTPILSPVAP